MNLNNALPTPTGIRQCYWHSDFDPVPFCLTSKMTEKETRDLLAMEDLIANETFQIPCQTENLSIDGQTLRIKTGKKENYTYFLEKNFLPKTHETQFGSCNTQTSDGVPPISTINRRDFLAR